ncbi:MAG: hypothetical protein KDA54_10280 [Phycisphaerales bacterium]|nr:hypothetical protein [Phycisphaerales bacterium]
MNGKNAILGIHDGHNASACVIVDGKVEYFVQEERLRYKKNYWGFPTECVRDALKVTGLTQDDLKAVVFDTEARVPRNRDLKEVLFSFERLLKTSGLLRMACIHALGTGIGGQAKKGIQVRKNYLAECGITAPIPVKAYNHHLCHAASAYYAMREDLDSEHLVLTLDGAGEKYCSTVSIAKDGELRKIADTAIGDSLGTIYAVITFLMGFVPYEHEYKLMGMAPYCAPNRAEEAAQMFHHYLGVREDGLGFRRKKFLPMNMQMKSLLRDMQMMRFDTLAAGLQKFTEDLMLEWVKRCIEKTKVRKVVCGGGVFMNVKANKLIMDLPETEYLGVLPSCGDESLAYGAAALAWKESEGASSLEPWGSIYFGHTIDDAEAEKLLTEKGIKFSKPDDIERSIAELLASGHPVARCRGGMEFGARALGNRSILADPSLQDCVRVINHMVKKRDFWMPFAPMVLKERMHDYLVNPKSFGSPHMMLSYDTKDNFPEFIAAVQNADLTARAQILEEAHNPDMYRCLKHFESITGRGVILNTSFNLHGYPVCMGPKEAIHVFENSGLEYLALGSLLATKK